LLTTGCLVSVFGLASSSVATGSVTRRNAGTHRSVTNDAPAAPTCANSNLTITVGTADTLSAVTDLPVNIANSSQNACQLNSYWPQVEAMSNGQEVGFGKAFYASSFQLFPYLAGFDYTSAPTTVTIQPGSTASFALIIPLATNDPGCPTIDTLQFSPSPDLGTAYSTSGLPDMASVTPTISACSISIKQPLFVTPLVTGSDPVSAYYSQTASPDGVSDGPGFGYGGDDVAPEPCPGNYDPAYIEDLQNCTGATALYLGYVGDYGGYQDTHILQPLPCMAGLRS
jgi:hypothetical protein